MRNLLTLAGAAVLVLAACGGDDAGDSVADTAGVGGSQGAASGGSLVDPQPPGQASASVDGREYTFTEPGALSCTIAEDAITFSFRIGDNEVTLGGGANRYDTGWLGGVDLRIANPTNEPGPISYFPELAAHGDGIAIEGDSMSYSGPMMKQPPNDGSNPAPVSAGEGVFSVTCG